jgi:hypothetical protein
VYLGWSFASFNRLTTAFEFGPHTLGKWSIPAPLLFLSFGH